MKLLYKSFKRLVLYVVLLVMSLLALQSNIAQPKANLNLTFTNRIWTHVLENCLYMLLPRPLFDGLFPALNETMSPSLPSVPVSTGPLVINYHVIVDLKSQNLRLNVTTSGVSSAACPLPGNVLIDWQNASHVRIDWESCS